ncbi:MAG: CinA family nicotinamide mononucleotide deamidase-related protein [Myxococcota bacterium]|nr:CinA family nicotinamide mononucleotide deamidase-related protein [Myxococcota bacterium]
MTTRAIILTQGSELLSGSISDHNAAYLCERLHNIGIRVLEYRCVDDDQNDIANALIDASRRSDIVICTGGLGQTEDDLSREACAQAFSTPLVESKPAKKQVDAFYRKRNRTPPKRSTMHLLPKGAIFLHNPFGSAPAFSLSFERCQIYFLPGVPVELEGLYALHLEPSLKQYHKDWSMVEFGCFGAGESTLSKRLAGQLDCTISYRASRKGNSVKLHFPSAKPSISVLQKAKHILEPYLFAEGHCDLARSVGKLLLKQNATVSAAESCTSGKVSAWITSVPGASRYFLEGAVVYSNHAKQKYCDVSSHSLQNHGAVSKRVAIELAEGIQKRAQSTWGISITGIAGPGGGSKEKPVGTVHIAVSNGKTTVHRHLTLRGSRDQITDSSAAHVLFLLYQQLKELEM